MDSMTTKLQAEPAQPAFDPGYRIRLAWGMALLLAAMAVFAHLASAVMAGAPLTELDRQLAQALHLHATAHDALRMVLLAITHLHSTPGVLALLLAAAWWIWRRGERRWSVTVVGAVTSGMLLNFMLKHVFVRARPGFEAPILELASYSFPSGHTMAATMLYGVLACYLARHVRTQGARVAAFVLAALCIGTVAFSRMYLGAHYLTDVLAAFAEGCAWLTVCLGVASSWRWRS